MTAITLRLDDATYELLRTEAFENRTTITALIRESLARDTAVTGLTFRANPLPPSEDELHELFSLSGGKEWGVAGLRAVWRHGCDAGMVAK